MRKSVFILLTCMLLTNCFCIGLFAKSNTHFLYFDNFEMPDSLSHLDCILQGSRSNMLLAAKILDLQYRRVNDIDEIKSILERENIGNSSVLKSKKSIEYLKDSLNVECLATWEFKEISEGRTKGEYYINGVVKAIELSTMTTITSLPFSLDIEREKMRIKKKYDFSISQIQGNASHAYYSYRSIANLGVKDVIFTSYNKKGIPQIIIVPLGYNKPPTGEFSIEIEKKLMISGLAYTHEIGLRLIPIFVDENNFAYCKLPSKVAKRISLSENETYRALFGRELIMF